MCLKVRELFQTQRCILPPGFTSSRYQVEPVYMGGKKGGLMSVLVLDMSRLSLAEWCLMLGSERSFLFGGGGADKEINCVPHQKWRLSDTLPTVSRAFGTCQRVCLILLSCVLSYCAPTFSSDIEFCGLCHTYDEPTVTAFRCFLFWTSIGNNSRAQCLSWSVIFDVIPYKCQQLFPQTGSGFICYLLYLPVPLNFMCVGPHCTSWLTCCVYLDSRPDSGWHRQTGWQWEGRRLRHGIFDQRLAQSSRKLKQLATQIHWCIIILMAWH